MCYNGDEDKFLRMHQLQAIQPMLSFEPRADPTNTSARWTKWLERFETYLVAANITNNARKRALLLYQAGSEVHEIFKTLPNTGETDDYDLAVTALTTYFEPDKNRIYQIYTFRQTIQQAGETIDEFHTRLRTLAKHCEFHDEDFEIKMQIVCHGTSSRLRKRALKDQTYSLKDMLIDGRKLETSTAQASGMAEQVKRLEVNEVRGRPTEKHCFNCGFEYPHTNGPCPARSATCSACGIKGHYSRVCRKEQNKRPRANQQRNNRNNEVKAPATPKKQHAKAVQEDATEDSNHSSSSDDDYAYNVRGESGKSLVTTVRVNGHEVKFLIDTGATVDIIDNDTYNALEDTVCLKKSGTKIFAYGSNRPLQLKGRVQATLESKKRFTATHLFVIEGSSSGNLMSAKTAQDLGIIKLINTVSVNTHNGTDNSAASTETPSTSDKTIQEIINRHHSVFQGQGKLRDQRVQLHINRDVKPVVQPQRRIPYHMRKQVSQELQKLVEQDIIEPVVDQPTPWISPIVCTPKKNGELRICVDMREANQAIERERHIMPTLQDFKTEVNGSKYFSKLDLKQAYHQLELDPESRYVTTFSTHDGLFRYKRLNYGTNSAAELFQNTLETNLRDIKGVKNMVDDIIIHGRTRKEHDDALENCLARLESLNLKVKAEKCEFLKQEIKFFGLIFSASGTRPDPERITHLVNAPPPKNVSEVRSFLGMANTCSEYIPDYAIITAPLRSLTKKNIVFSWKQEHQVAFQKLKNRLTKAPVMAYFDTNKRSLVIVDGSQHGISAILAQRENNAQQSYKIIAYASRGLSPVESRYSQTDIEGLSLVWGVEHFRLFLQGSDFDVITDHKALEAIFNNPRSKPPARIERWMMRLQSYNFRVIYQKGLLNAADYLSRHPAAEVLCDQEITELAENYVNYVTTHAIPKLMTMAEITKATEDDPVLARVQESLRTGKWDYKDQDLKPYQACADELTINGSQNILLRGTRIVVPSELQKKAVELGHVGHQGKEKTKALIREKIWFPGMNKAVDDMIDNCIACQAVGRQNPPEPMEIQPTECTPWETVAIDFYGPIPQVNKYLLVVTDTYSKFPEVEIVSSTDAKSCIPLLDRIFAAHGIPTNIRTDNGPPFNGYEMERYMTALGINWTTSTPLWPQGNAHVERFMKPLGKSLQTAKLEGRPWKQELYRFLLSYRTTPHATTKVAPCELLFNRTIRGHLPELRDSTVVDKHDRAKDNIEKSKQRNKSTYDRVHKARKSNIIVGDIVLCKQDKQNKLTPTFDPDPLTVTHRSHNTVTASNENYTVTRNASFFKKLPAAFGQDGEESDTDIEGEEVGEEARARRYEELELPPQNQPAASERPKRNTKPVRRFGFDE